MPDPSSSFHSTRWTLVRRAQGHGEEARTALSELCAIYYDPVHQFICRFSGDEAKARDLAHAFFEELLGREAIGAADPTKGRFRSYLSAAVKHFVFRHRERDAAQKRGGGEEHLPLEDGPIEGTPSDWDLDFDRAWALALIRRALDALAAEMEAAGKVAHFETLRPWLDGGSPGDPVEAGQALGLSSTALKVAIHRLRERFRQKIRDEIAATTS